RMVALMTGWSMRNSGVKARRKMTAVNMDKNAISWMRLERLVWCFIMFNLLLPFPMVGIQRKIKWAVRVQGWVCRLVRSTAALCPGQRRTLYGSGRENAMRLWKRVDGSGIIDPDRKSTRLNPNHVSISYAVFCLKKKNK